MASLVVPVDWTPAMREAYHEIARREGKLLSVLINETMAERYPEAQAIVEEIVAEGGPEMYRMNHYGIRRRNGRKVFRIEKGR